MTNVETTTATAADGEVTPKVLPALRQRDLLSALYTVNTGVLDAELLVESREDYGVDWVPRARTGVGKPGSPKGSAWPISPLTFRGAKPSVPKGARV